MKLSGDELMRAALADEAARSLQQLSEAGELTPESARNEYDRLIASNQWLDKTEAELARLQDAGKLTPQVARDIIEFDLPHASTQEV